MYFMGDDRDNIFQVQQMRRDKYTELEQIVNDRIAKNQIIQACAGHLEADHSRVKCDKICIGEEWYSYASVQSYERLSHGHCPECFQKMMDYVGESDEED